MSNEEVEKMLRERFGKDEFIVKGLNYISWELGFQRGMEYQKELDQRVLNLSENVKGVIDNFLGKVEGGE